MEAEERRHVVGISWGKGLALSLEDELAEATRDLLGVFDRGQDSSLPQHAAIRPSPDPSSSDTEASHIKSPPGLNVGQAYGIDKSARLTPILADSARGQGQVLERGTKSSSSTNDGDNCAAGSLQGSSTDLRFPASHLNDTAAPVGSPPMRDLPLSASQLAARNRSEAVNRDLEMRLATLKPKRSGRNLRIDAERSRQLEGLQARLRGSRTPGLLFTQRSEDAASSEGSSQTSPAAPPTGDFRASGSRAPAFFLQSFPEAVSYLERQDVADDSTSDGASTSYQDAETVAPGSSSLNVLNSGLTHTENLSKGTTGHLDDQQADYFENTEDGALADYTLQELDPAALPKSLSDDAQSLLSLSATADTASSGSARRNARKRQSKMMRRRSSGGQSLVTVGSSSLGDDSGFGDAGASDAGPFARTVTIRGFSIVGAKARGHVAYDVRITLRSGTMVSLLRRFSSFVSLRQALVKECGDGKAKSKRTLPTSHAAGSSSEANGSANVPCKVATTVLPALPPRRAGLLHKYAAHHLEARRLALQRWLQIVMLDEVYGTSAALRQWVVGSDEDEQAQGD